MASEGREIVKLHSVAGWQLLGLVYVHICLSHFLSLAISQLHFNDTEENGPMPYILNGGEISLSNVFVAKLAWYIYTLPLLSGTSLDH